MRTSVVMLAYKQRKYLSQAIESVVAERDRVGADVELIVVEAGSPDGVLDVCRAYASEIDILVTDRDRGAAEGLNHGFKRATGEIFAFLNGDDYFLPEWYSRVEKPISSMPTIDVFMGRGYKLLEDRLKFTRVVPGRFSVAGYFAGSSPFLQQAIFFRRRSFELVGGFNEHNRTCWDGELLLDFAARGLQFENLAQDLAVFRIHGASITGSGRLNVAYEADQKRLAEKFNVKLPNRSTLLANRVANRARRIPLVAKRTTGQ